MKTPDKVKNNFVEIVIRSSILLAANVFVVEFAGALPTANLSHVKTRFKGSKKTFERIRPSKLNYMLWTAARAVASARGQGDPKSGRAGRACDCVDGTLLYTLLDTKA